MTGWKRTLFILAFVQFVSAVGMSSIVPFLPLFVEELGSSTGLSVELLAGLVFSAQAFTMMIAGPIWGAIADRHGRKLMVVRATLGGSVVVCLMAFARTAEDLVFLRAVQGIVTGVFSAITALIAANVPRERVGYALGTLQIGLWGGLSIGPLMGGVIADTFSFQAAFIITAALLAVSGILAWWGVEEDFEPIPRSSHRPGFVTAWQHIMTSEGMKLTYLNRFLSQLGRAMVMPFVALAVQDLMTNADRAATLSGTIIGVGAFAGTIIALWAGRMGDRIGHQRVLAVTAAVTGLSYLPIAFVHNIWLFALLLTLASAAMGGVFPTLSALLAGYSERGEEGMVFGLENSIMAAARTLSPLFGALLISVAGIGSLFAVAAVLLLITTFVAEFKLPKAQPVSIPAPCCREPAAPPQHAR